MTLETLVRALACLSTTTTTTTNGPKSMAVIMQNSVEPFKVDNATLGGCPVGTLSGLASRIQYMTEELQTLQMDLTELQQLFNDYKNEQPVYRLDSRIGPSSLSAVVGQSVAAAGSVDDTPRSCWDQKHGEVRIRPGPDMQPFFVNCDQEVRDGGWTVIAYRHDGSEDFNRNWENYKAGFGSLKGEFFIGLDKLHRLTNSADHELLILMQSQTNEQRFALYDQFSIGNEAEKYLMYLLGTYKGDAGDSLRYHAGKKFTTFDQDNDDNGQNCARTHAGAWWYGRECFESNLFGTFQSKYGQEIGYFKGILWKTFVPGPTGSLRYVRMLIRPLKKT